MIKLDIVNEVSKTADITKVKAELAVDAVFDAMEVVCEQFDPAYAPDPDSGDRNHLYFW